MPPHCCVQASRHSALCETPPREQAISSQYSEWEGWGTLACNTLAAWASRSSESIVAPAIEQYAARMVRATQPANSRVLGDMHAPILVDEVNRYVSFGSSPRGAQALILGAKVGALLDGRANIAREDIERIAVSSLAHRIMLNYAAHSDGIDAAHIVERVIKSVRAARV